MNRTYFFLIASILIVGCTTPYDLKKSRPVISYVTPKPAVEVKKCILKSWSSHQPTVFEEKTNEGWMIRFNDTLPAATVAIVTIEGTEPDVEVNYYHRTNRLKIHRMEEEVKSCK
jgi:hypothetical protein